MTSRDKTPTFIALCPECDCLIACVVADAKESERFREAVVLLAEWATDGYKVSTVTVHDIHVWPKGTIFTHAENCSRAERPKTREAQENLAF